MVVVMSFCGLCLLLVSGKILRSLIPLFQKLYLPASVIGGMLGLLLINTAGPHLSPNWFAGWDALPGFLINIVFASLFLGAPTPKLRGIWNITAPQLCFGQIIAWGQYAVGLGLTGLVLLPLFGVPIQFGNLLEIDQANLAYTRQGSLPDIGSFLRENLSSVTIGQLAADHNAVRITNSELSVNVFAVRASVTESAQTLDNSVVIQDSTFVGDHQFDVIAVNGLGSETGSLASQQSSVVISNVKHDGQSFYSIAADQLQLAISVSSSDASVILDNFQTDANATGQICASNLQGRHNAEALNGTLAIRHSSVTGTLGGSLVALSLLYGDTSFGSVVAHNNALEISDSTLGENLSEDSASAYGVKATSGTPASFNLHYTPGNLDFQQQLVLRFYLDDQAWKERKTAKNRGYLKNIL